jgi:hypothetical protein
MALQPDSNVKKNTAWLKNTLSNSKRIHACCKEINKIPQTKGIYFWFMRSDAFSALNKISWPKDIQFNYSQRINGSTYHLVYLGTAGVRNNANGENNGNLRERLKWHLCDSKGVSALCHGTMSTYRRTIGSLLFDDLVAANNQALIDDFLCKNLIIYYIEYPGNFAEVQNEVNNDESILIKNLRPIFNLDKNPNAKIPGNISHSIQLRRQKVEKSSKKKWCETKTIGSPKSSKELPQETSNNSIVLDNSVEFIVRKNQNLAEVASSIANLPSGPCSIEIFTQNHAPVKKYINGKTRIIRASNRSVTSYFYALDTMEANTARWKIIWDEMNDTKNAVQKITVRVSPTSDKQVSSNRKKPKPVGLIKANSTKNDVLQLTKNFKVVMICAGKKRNSFFTKYPTITFVCDPHGSDQKFPDGDGPQNGKTWRDYLKANQNDKNLLAAYQLYANNAYHGLHNKLKDSFYILSAGWGLVRSDYKLPNYDITFSEKAASQNKRTHSLNEKPVFHDFKQIESSNMEDIIYIGTHEYLPLFFQLTQHLPNRKIIYWKRKTPQIVPNAFPAPNSTFIYRFYETKRNNVWYYNLAIELCNGIIP